MILVNFVDRISNSHCLVRNVDVRPFASDIVLQCMFREATFLLDNILIGIWLLLLDSLSNLVGSEDEELFEDLLIVLSTTYIIAIFIVLFECYQFGGKLMDWSYH